MPFEATLFEFTKTSLVKLADVILLFSHAFHLSSNLAIERQPLATFLTLGYPQMQRLHQINLFLPVELLLTWPFSFIGSRPAVSGFRCFSLARIITGEGKLQLKVTIPVIVHFTLQTLNAKHLGFHWKLASTRPLKWSIPWNPL